VFIAVPNAQACTGSYWAYEDFTHSTIFTSGSISFVIREAGFTSVEFIDIDANHGVFWLKRIVRSILLYIYTKNFDLWNIVTRSSFHRDSPRIFSYELKVIVRNHE